MMLQYSRQGSLTLLKKRSNNFLQIPKQESDYQLCAVPDGMLCPTKWNCMARLNMHPTWWYWAKNEPLVVINHVQLRLVMECSVELNEISETECIPPDGAGTAAFQNATTASPQPTVSLTIVISISAVCGALLLITLIVIAVSIFCCRYVKRKTKAKIRRNDSM